MSTREPNRAERALALLEKRYPGWVPAIEFERPCGRQAWRTAISEARQLAKRNGDDIENQQRRQTNGDEVWTLSEYRLKKRSEIQADPVSAVRGFDANAQREGRLI